MSLKQIAINLVFWVVLITAFCFLSTQFFADATLNHSIIANAIFYALQAFAILALMGAAVKFLPIVNITMVVFALLMIRFLLSASFFVTYKLSIKPEGWFFALPFGILFVIYVIIENTYLLQYANYIEKKLDKPTKP